MIDEKKVAKAVSKGLSIVCATCSWYWKARDAGIPGDRCAAEKPCGGPLSGLVFPEYDGPITQFSGICFVCGNPPDYGVWVNGDLAGVCDTHFRVFEWARDDIRILGGPKSREKTLAELMEEEP